MVLHYRLFVGEALLTQRLIGGDGLRPAASRIVLLCRGEELIQTPCALQFREAAGDIPIARGTRLQIAPPGDGLGGVARLHSRKCGLVINSRLRLSLGFLQASQRRLVVR